MKQLDTLKPRDVVHVVGPDFLNMYADYGVITARFVSFGDTVFYTPDGRHEKLRLSHPEMVRTIYRDPTHDCIAKEATTRASKAGLRMLLGGENEPTGLVDAGLLHLIPPTCEDSLAFVDVTGASGSYGMAVAEGRELTRLTIQQAIGTAAIVECT